MHRFFEKLSTVNIPRKTVYLINICYIFQFLLKLVKETEFFALKILIGAWGYSEEPIGFKLIIIIIIG